MFNFLKKQIHESKQKQISDLQEEPIAPLSLAGEDCDMIFNGKGPFGHSYNNPIPVNGTIGTYKYLRKLVTQHNTIVFFHRIGALKNEISRHLIDAFELVDTSGSLWDLIFVDVYHPRRSNFAPAGYRLKPYDKKIGDIPFAFGVDVYCSNFPYDLPDAINRRNGTPAFARRVSEYLNKYDYKKPELQINKIQALKTKLCSMQT